MILRRDLSEVLREGIDKAVFQGTGADEQPAGLNTVLTGGRTAALTAKASFSALLLRAVEIMETAKLSDPSQVRIAGAPILMQTLMDTLLANTAVSEFDRLKAAGFSPVFSSQVSTRGARDGTARMEESGCGRLKFYKRVIPRGDMGLWLWSVNCFGGKTLKLWPFSKRETRSQGAYTASYVQSARMAAMGTETALSATIATCSGVWTRSIGMLSAEGGAADALNPAVLSAIGADLFWRGESCWHIAFDGSDLALTRAAHWDEQAGGRFLLSIPTPDGTESIKALSPEVVRLVINPDPAMPWRGRSPLAFLGLSAKLMADLEGAVVNALPYAGKGILPLPANLGEQSGAVTAGLRSGGLAVITSKADLAHHTGGRAEE